VARSSVPAKRVFCHDRSRNLLCADAAALTAVTSSAASAAGCDAAIASTMHPSSSTTRDGAAACAGHRAGARVSGTLVPVPASHEEHGSAVCDGTNDSTAGDSGTGGVDLAAGANVTSNGATITSSPGGRSLWLAGGDVWRAALARKLTACCERTRSVDQVGKDVDCRVLVVPERISRVAKLGSKRRLEVLGDGEESQGSDEALVLCRVKRLQSVVVDLRDGDVETICDSLRQVVEDLVAAVPGGNEGVVQGPLETDLTHELVF
jgi:hypothetical protein